ncbi:hypothetical protein FQA47_020371 [Oryzias melastigma]|uniref:Uncharacterized protein n=1 Tax=Oryzias melastigma TaxID=30732 RepID=A0A834C8A9_ORYME|nr:hypothetical protein FQA47_020371 [Oryzias melastigma]
MAEGLRSDVDHDLADISLDEGDEPSSNTGILTKQGSEGVQPYQFEPEVSSSEDTGASDDDGESSYSDGAEKTIKLDYLEEVPKRTEHPPVRVSAAAAATGGLAPPPPSRPPSPACNQPPREFSFQTAGGVLQRPARRPPLPASRPREGVKTLRAGSAAGRLSGEPTAPLMPGLGPRNHKPPSARRPHPGRPERARQVPVHPPRSSSGGPGRAQSLPLTGERPSPLLKRQNSHSVFRVRLQSLEAMSPTASVCLSPLSLQSPDSSAPRPFSPVSLQPPEPSAPRPFSPVTLQPSPRIFSPPTLQPCEPAAPRIFSPPTLQPLDPSAPRPFSPVSLQSPEPSALPLSLQPPDPSAPRPFSPPNLQPCEPAAPRTFSPVTLQPCEPAAPRPFSPLNLQSCEPSAL